MTSPKLLHWMPIHKIIKKKKNSFLVSTKNRTKNCEFPRSKRIVQMNTLKRRKERRNQWKTKKH